MASVDSTPARELSDSDLRKRLLSLGYDVPVSVNRDFLVKKLENVSSGGGGRSSKRHSMAPTPTASPSTARKRKSVAGTPTNNSNASRGHQQHHPHQNNVRTPSMPPSPFTSMSPPATPQYSSSPSISVSTPSTPSPFVSRLNTPSPSSSPANNGDSASHNPSPRYMSYYNMFKTSTTGGGGMGTPTSGDGGGYGYAYNRSIRLSAPPGGLNPVTSVAPPTRSSERNGYATGGQSMGVESDWCGGHFISKILVGAFILFFVVIGLLYLRQSTIMEGRGLAGSVGDSEATPDIVVKEPPPIASPPPPSHGIKKAPVPPQLPHFSMIFPVCGSKGTDPEACIPKEIVKDCRAMFNALKVELTQRAKKKGCHADVQETISLQKAKSLLHELTGMRKADIDRTFEGMLLLVTENPREGLRLSAESFGDKEISSKDVVAGLDMTLTQISAPEVNPEFLCGIIAFLTSVTWTVTIAAGSAGVGFICYKLFGLYRQKKKTEEQQIFTYVERILELLQHQYELSESAQGPSFLAVNHIRDELVPPQERQKKEALWNKVVHHISNNESRVREEIQHISGEEFRVWRWLPSASPLASKRFSTAKSQKMNRYSMPASPMMASSFASHPLTSTPAGGMSPPQSPLQNNLYPNLSTLNGDEDDMGEGGGSDPNSNNKWQGQAFETCEGSPNALPSTPTTCLKIRHMFTERDTSDSDRARIEQEILGKCRGANILHIGIDQASVEGCVYIRCLTKEDARKAFMSLHGWWFDGHLLSVKFLREERYFSRFPEAKHLTATMGLSR